MHSVMSADPLAAMLGVFSASESAFELGCSPHSLVSV